MTTPGIPSLPLELGQHVTVRARIGSVEYPFQASVIGVDWTGFEISVPRRSSMRLPVNERDVLELTIVTRDGLFECTCTAVEVAPHSISLTLAGAGTVQLIQRRQHPRVSVPASPPTAVDVVPEWGDPLQAWLRDLSLEGCGLFVRGGVMDGMPVSLQVHFPDHPLHLAGEIAHATELPTAPESYLYLGVRFGPLSDAERDALEAAMQRLKEASDT